MNRRHVIAGILALCAASGVAGAVGDKGGKKPERYRVHVMQVADTSPTQFVFRVGEEGQRGAQPEVVYKTLSSRQLKGWVAYLPKGTTILYLPSCLGPSPFQTRELDEFEAYCQSHGVLFPRYLAG